MHFYCIIRPHTYLTPISAKKWFYDLFCRLPEEVLPFELRRLCNFCTPSTVYQTLQATVVFSPGRSYLGILNHHVMSDMPTQNAQLGEMSKFITYWNTPYQNRLHTTYLLSYRESNFLKQVRPEFVLQSLCQTQTSKSSIWWKLHNYIQLHKLCCF